MDQQDNKGLIIGIIVVTVLIFLGLVLVLMKAPSATPVNQQKDEAVSFFDENDPVIGPADAKMTVHIYGDFQCPACRAAEGGVKYAMDKYKDRVRFVWKDFPLMQIHPNARAAANAARCAQNQNKFWEYHDRLFMGQPTWAKAAEYKTLFVDYAKELGLDPSLFQTCLSSQNEDQKVVANMSEGGRNRVDATPTFFIKQRRYFAMTPQEWDAVLGAALRF